MTSNNPASGGSGPLVTSATLYAELPVELGGVRQTASSSSSRAISLNALLPRAHRAPPGPPDTVLHAAVRNRALLLDKERSGSQNRGGKGKASRNIGKATSDGAAARVGPNAVVSRKAARRARAMPAVVPPGERVYSAYLPLRDLWADYAARVVGDDDWSVIGERLVRLDLHGAVVEVTRARDPGLIGIKGILIIETANTIIVIIEKNRVITVPKASALITLTIGNRRFEIALPMLPYRASERSARKFKKKHLALF